MADDHELEVTITITYVLPAWILHHLLKSLLSLCGRNYLAENLRFACGALYLIWERAVPNTGFQKYPVELAYVQGPRKGAQCSQLIWYLPNIAAFQEIAGRDRAPSCNVWRYSFSR